MDEPSMGLAPLLVEQNARKALKIAHRGYVLQTGTVEMSGLGEELLHNSLVVDAYLG